MLWLSLRAQRSNLVGQCAPGSRLLRRSAPRNDRASMDPYLCCGCHCERSEAISSGNAHPDRDCFVAALLAMTGRAWILIIRIWYQAVIGALAAVASTTIPRRLIPSNAATL